MLTVLYFCHQSYRMFQQFITTIITQLQALKPLIRVSIFIGKCEFQSEYIVCQQRRKGFSIKLFSTFKIYILAFTVNVCHTPGLDFIEI